VAERSTARVCGCSLAVVAVSNPASGMHAYFVRVICVLSEGPITHLWESYGEFKSHCVWSRAKANLYTYSGTGRGGSTKN
jgi:hypothetical protein